MNYRRIDVEARQYGWVEEWDPETQPTDSGQSKDQNIIKVSAEKHPILRGLQY